MSHRGSRVALILLIVACVPGAAGAVVVTEIHYNPVEGPALEFVELHNPGAVAAPVGGWSFVAGIRYTFPEGAVIEPGGHLIVCRDRDAFLARFDVSPDRVLGNFGGALDNGGERIVLEDRPGERVEDFRYDDDAPWDAGADGEGESLQRVCVTFSASHAGNWRGGVPGPLAPGAVERCPPPDLPPPPVAINEIYYHPLGDRDEDEELVELRNNTGAAINLRGYSFSDGIRFTFEEDHVLEPGGFVVVCRNAEHVRQSFAIDNAVGDFEGQLSNDGERLTLVDASSAFVDSVRYGDDGDWPVAADGLGHSLEKIVPTAIGDDPASWTAATHRTTDGWSTFSVTGTATSSRFFIYLGDEGEILVDNVVLEEDGNPGTNLVPNGTFDAGLEPWEGRGNHADTTYEPDGGPDGSGAMRIVSNGRGSGSSNGVRINLDPEPLRDGTVYRLSFDMLHVTGTRTITARLSGSTSTRGLYLGLGTGPALSPGAENAVKADRRPPFISEISRSPREPGPDDVTWITARVRGDSSVVGVELTYSVDTTEPAGTVEMLDDGAHMDGAAGDGVFGASLPAQEHNSIVLFRIAARDEAGSSSISPHSEDPTGYHGYYVDGLQPESPLPVYHVLLNHKSGTPPRALTRSGALNCNSYRTASFAFRGDLWFNVGLRRRGQSVCSAQKPFMKLRFQRGRDFEGQHKINLQSLWTDKSLIRERLAWDVFHDVGSPYCRDHFIRLHINGEYFGLYADLEHPDSRFLDRNRLNGNGNLYKAVASREERTGSTGSITSSYEKKTNENGDFSDLAEFLDTLHSTPRNRLVEFFAERVDEDRMIDYQLAQILTNNRDYPHKNHYLYHDLETGKWMPITWDMDLTFGKRWSRDFGGVYHDLMDTPGITPWYTTSVDGGGTGNHLLDKFFSQSGTRYQRAYLVRLWDAIVEKYTPEFFEGEIETFRDLLMEEQQIDIDAWGRTPATANDPTAPAEFLPNLDRVRDHIRARRSFLTSYIRSRARTIPDHDRLKITEVFYNPVGGGDEHEFIELWNSSGRAVDLGGWSIEGVGYIFPEGSTVEENEVFVVARDVDAFRARYGDGVRVFGPYDGRLDNDGETLRVKDAGPGYPATIDFLRYDSGVDLSGEQWPERADGLGHSIELTDVHAARDNDLGRYWKASDQPGGTPGLVAGVNSSTEVLFRRGDVNADGEINLTDAIRILNYLFMGGDAPGCLESADANADTEVRLSDAVFLLNALFVDGSPPLPSPAHGECAPSTDGFCERSNCVDG